MMEGKRDAVSLEAVTPDLLERRGVETCLVRSGEHHAWWRAERQGYTTHRPSAGRYAFTNAHEASRHCGPEKAISYEFEGPET